MSGLQETVDPYAARRLKVLKQTSASQIDMYERCPRIWWNSYIEGVKPLPSPAQQRGTDIDDNYVQPYLRTGNIRKDGEWAALLVALIPHLPPPANDQVKVQARIDLPTFDGGPICIGFMDWARGVTDEHLHVGDLKTTSDFRYAKTREQLADNTQMVVYAKAGYALFQAQKVSISHVYARTRGSAKALSVPAASEDPIWMPRSEVNEKWERRVETIKQMMRVAATVNSADELPPNTSECGAYGGCAFRAKCGLSTISANGKGKFGMEKESNGGSSLMARMAAKRLQSQGAAPAAKIEVVEINPQTCSECDGRKWVKSKDVDAPPGAFLPCMACAGTGVASASVSASVLPPDAPARTSTPEEIQALVESAKPKVKEKKEKKITVKCPQCDEKVVADTFGEHFQTCKAMIETPVEVLAPVPSAPAASSAPVSTSTPAMTNRKALKVPPIAPMLLIDTVVLKGVKDPVLFESWFAPIAELAAAAHEVQDYRLISYTAKGVLATAIRECLDTCPSALVINSQAPGADVALEVLIPHASMVLRGVR